MSNSKHKTWVEINQKAIAHNVSAIKSTLKPKTKLWAVVKSNAYGHGLLIFSKLINRFGVGGFCVDSVIEGLKLRKNGIKKPILVLGPTLSNKLLDVAEKQKLTITIPNPDLLNAFIKNKKKPQFHIKIDTGMRRQGFYVSELPKVLKQITNYKLPITNYLKGIYTHFASAKDLNYPTYTDIQFAEFQKAVLRFEKAGFRNLIKHTSATGGILINQKYHLDAVRSGIGLYGLWPSKELMMQRRDIKFKPVLSWHTIISEVKILKKNDFIGYDLIERVNKPTKIAILPIGYWHGFPWALSGIGEMLIHGHRVRILGRVSMDLVAVNANNVPCRVGDKATIIGRQENDELYAFDVARKLGTIHYELVTRINPLIERIVK